MEMEGGRAMEEETAIMESGRGKNKRIEGHEKPNEEDEWILDHLTWFRDEWTAMWSSHYGSVDKRTEVPPMRFNKEPVPSYAYHCPALQIFSVKVVELKGIIWPIDVYGSIALRDSVDRNLNYIFERDRDNYQTLTAKDSSLILTGPSRAVLLIDAVEFEVELRVKGIIPSEDKLLIAEFFGYDCIASMHRAGGPPQTYLTPSLRSTLEFKYAHLSMALEAAIKVLISEGSTDFCGKFVVRTSGINENVTLLDSRNGMVSISEDGVINFSRSVVVVERWDDRHEELIVGVEARQGGYDDETSHVCREVSFIPAKSGESHGTVDMGFCKMSIVVSWSLVY